MSRTGLKPRTNSKGSTFFDRHLVSTKFSHVHIFTSRCGKAAPAARKRGRLARHGADVTQGIWALLTDKKYDILLDYLLS